MAKSKQIPVSFPPAMIEQVRQKSKETGMSIASITRMLWHGWLSGEIKLQEADRGPNASGNQTDLKPFTMATDSGPDSKHGGPCSSMPWALSMPMKVRGLN